MRLRVPDLLEQHGITAYELAKRSEGRIGLNTAYRLAKGEWKALSKDVLEALCDVFGIDDPGPLFEREARKRKTGKN